MLGGGGGGAIGQFPLEQWFYEMPVCTRYWTTATIATSVLVQCHVITPFQLFYSFRAVFVKNQVGACRKRFYVSLGNIANFDLLLTVLAHPDHLPILRSPLPRPSLPRLLPSTLLTPPRRIIRPLSSPFLLASSLCHNSPARSFAHAQHTFSRISLIKLASVHMEQEESGNETEFPRVAGIYGTVLAVGLDGV